MTGPVRDARLDGLYGERLRWVDGIKRRIAQHEENLAGWADGGILVPTEPDAEERDRIRSELAVAIGELRRLAEEMGVKFDVEVSG